MKQLYSLKKHLLLVMGLLLITSMGYSQVTVLKSTESLSSSESDVVYFTAYGCDGKVQWLNWLGEVIGTGNTGKDTPGCQCQNTYSIVCNGVRTTFYIQKTASVRSTAPTVSADKTTINNGEAVTLTAAGCMGSVTWMSGEFVLANNSPTYTVNPSVTTNYFALCTESGKAVSLPSTQTITVNVNNPSLNPPSITTSALTNSFEAGVNTKLGSFGCYYTVEWFKNGTSIGTGTQIEVNGTIGDIYTAKCTSGSTVSGASNQLTVTPPCPSPTFTTQPQNVKVCSGGTINLTAVASADAVSYQWYRNNAPISGQTSANLTIANATAANAGLYKIVAWNGCGKTVTSQTITVNVSTLNLSTSITHVSCFGGNNGAITTNAIGGTAPYSYSWQTGQTTNQLTGLAAGTYNVTATDASGCSVGGVIYVNQPAALTATTSVVSQVSCLGGNNGSALVAPTGGTAPYSYAWSNGQTTAAATGLTAGNYTVTVTDAKNCTTNQSVTISQPALPLSLTATIATNVSCFGGNNGSASSIASGGTAPYSYLWSNGQATNNSSGLTAGTYTVTATDANGCTATQTIILSQPASALSATISNVTNVSCFGGTNGSGSVTATGGTAPYTYAWSNGQTTANISGLSAGNYTVTVTDANGCTTVQTLVISQPALLQASATQTNVSCFGGNNGSGSVTATGGTAPYTYAWSNGQTIANISGLIAGNYNIQVTDANGCTTNQTITITQPAAVLSATANVVSNVNCFGGTNGSGSVTATGGTAPYTYAWSNGQTSATATGLAAGNYNVTVTDANGCTATQNITITQPASAMVASISNVTNVSCFGGSNGGGSVAATGGTTPYTYAWSNGQTNATATGLVAGSYTVTVTDAKGCTVVSTLTISQPTEVNYTLTNSKNVTCKGNANGELAITATGGVGSYTYLWSNGQTTPAISGLAPGNYSVKITDANGCVKNSIIYTITEPNLLVAATNVQTLVSCFGGNNGSSLATATGGTAPYTYLWSNGQTTATANNLIAGTYNVTITDANGCTATQSSTITQPTVLEATTSQTDVLCFGTATGTATANVMGGVTPYTYAWSNGQTTAKAINLVAGSYTVVSTDANGCKVQKQVTITQPVELLVNLKATDVKCFSGKDGQAEVTVIGGTGPYTYAWSNGTTNSINTALIAGNYTVTITDKNGCSIERSTQVNQPTKLTLSATAMPAKCNEGAEGQATVIATGGTAPYSYSWNNGQLAPTATGLAAATYTATVTDLQGCKETATATVSQPAPLIFTYTKTDVNCFGGNDGVIQINAIGGTAPYRLLANGTAYPAASSNQLTANVYQVNVTDANQCVSKNPVSVEIMQPKTPVTAKLVEAVMPKGYGLSNGLIKIEVSGGTGNLATYQTSWAWDGGTNTNETKEVAGLSLFSTLKNVATGNYTFKVQDGNFAQATSKAGCMATLSYFMKQPDKLAATLNVVKKVSCYGKFDGQIASTPSGGVPFTTGEAYIYKWFKKEGSTLTDLGITTPTLSSVDAGLYAVKITDKNDNTDLFDVELKVTPSIDSKVVSLVNPSCGNTTNGSVEIQTIGGVAPITVDWGKGITGTKITNLPAGNYFGVIKDKDGCYGEVAVALTAKETASVSVVSAKEQSCVEKCDGRIELQVKGTTDPYTIQWSNGATTATVQNLCTGLYTAKITTKSGCQITSAPIELKAPAPYKVDISDNITLCSGSNVDIDAAAKEKAVSYKWTLPNGSVINNAVGTIRQAGNYTVEVTNATGCKASDTFTVNLVNATNTLAFTVASTGQVNETMYAVNLSPATVNATWKITGPATVVSQSKELLVITPTAVGKVTIELSAALGQCNASASKTVTILPPASTGVVKPTVATAEVVQPAVKLYSLNESVTVYPNPSYGEFTVKAATPIAHEKTTILLLDNTQMRYLHRQEVDGNLEEGVDVNLQNYMLQEGSYYLIIQTATDRTVKKIVIKK